MGRERTSKIWLVSIDELQAIIARSPSISQVLKEIGVDPYGGFHTKFKERCKKDGIDLSKFPRGSTANKGRKFGPHKTRIPNEKLFIENSHTGRNIVRRRLLSEKQIPYKCAWCGMGPQWKGKKLSLVLDHINGVNNDHRLENLRFLCPNCNAQTPTYGGKNTALAGTGGRNTAGTTKCANCVVCEAKISPKNISRKCRKCWHQSAEAKAQRENIGKFRRVKDRPTKEELQALIGENTWVSIGRMYGVSDNAIRKWAKDCGLPTIKKKKAAQLKACSVCGGACAPRCASGICRSCRTPISK